jgi:hypothetical protein
MSQMIVRPPSLWINPFGNLAEQYSVYVGKPFQDPTQTSSQLTVKDGRGEDANIVMQPIIVTEGVTRNSSGQKILPVIDSQNYSLLYVSTNGSRIYSESSFFGDGLSATGQGGALAEEVLNNLQQALSSDLTGFNYIFIQSEFIGWEGTSEGPAVNSLYYYNGGSGPSSTGDVFTFYDSAGNEWKLAKSVAEQTNEAGIATNTQAIADNVAEIASVNADLSAEIAANTANISSGLAEINRRLLPGPRTGAQQITNSNGINSGNLTGTYTVPNNAYMVRVTLVGAGGASGLATNSSDGAFSSGGGGGAGGVLSYYLDVTGGQNLGYTIATRWNTSNEPGNLTRLNGIPNSFARSGENGEDTPNNKEVDPIGDSQLSRGGDGGGTVISPSDNTRLYERRLGQMGGSSTLFGRDAGEDDPFYASGGRGGKTDAVGGDGASARFSGGGAIRDAGENGSILFEYWV